ncbi:unnamed protein product [Hymenolepis diminuta]|uniref:Ubiquitin-like domain-containing protein n=1 Tax=Hymenolepis diminuta TaxID=6216 RepID=A0A564XXU0_HYMDI|nr:unnamed protein product [Hymenolepis diminuta]
MTTLVEALQRKFEALVTDEITPLCKIKIASRSGKVPPICTRIIAMDHQEITTIGDPKEMIHIFHDMHELDISTNQIRLWSDIFEILECSPQLQSLNLSYNPLQDSPFFFELDENDDDTSNQQSDSPSNSSPSPSEYANNSNSNPADINLLAEISFSEEDRNENCNNSGLSLSRNPSASCLSPQLTILLLNSTRVPWKRVLRLLTYLPSLKTLHTALNDYSCCCPQDSSDNSFPQFPNLVDLYFSENRLTSWSDVCCLGKHFPSLQHIVLLRNPLQTIPIKSATGDEETPFTSVEDLNLMETLINSWESVDALNQWFPALKSLRLGKELPLIENCDAETFKYDVIARLPTLVSYNVTTITEEERERAERDFVRRFGQIEEVLRPQRFWELERQHGYVAPFVSVNLTPRKTVRMRIRFDDQEKWHTCTMRQTIARLKTELCALFGMSHAEARGMRLIYIDAGMVEATGPEELRFSARQLYTYHPNDGDTLVIAQRGA